MIIIQKIQKFSMFTIALILVNWMLLIASANAGEFNGSISKTKAFCPFCSTVNITLGEQLRVNELTVVATLIDKTKLPDAEITDDEDVPGNYNGTFKVLQIFKGENFIEIDANFETRIDEALVVGAQYLCFGIGTPNTGWWPPIPAEAGLADYLHKIQELPESGPERLVFFQEYLGHENKVLSTDAYDEFAIASYDDLLQMREEIDREKLLRFIQDKEVDENFRRLYFTMLGVAGNPQRDVPLLEKLIQSDDPLDRAGLDSLIACYLSLHGAAGLPLIERQFVDNPEIDYVLLHQVMAALRFHGTEAEIVPKEKLIPTVRKLLQRPELADLIIADLARWEDWEVLEQLIELFRTAEGKTKWLRVPIFQYLLACPREKAKIALAEFREVDPQSYQRALFLSNFAAADDDDDNDD